MFMEPTRPSEFITNLKELVNAGLVPLSRIDDAVKRILAIKFRTHLFERRFASMAMADSLGNENHRNIAREAVRKSIVLLKNEGDLLPLSKTSGKILVAGPKAMDIGSQCGGWTITWQGGTGQITTGTTIYNAVKSVRGSANVVYSANGTTTESVNFAIVVVGETPYAEGQGDSPNPQLSTAELNIIQKVKQLNIPYVVLLISGRPMLVTDVISDADAFVACWLPGTEALGLTDVLFGDYRFTGKLSHTWPSNISQEPINIGDAPYNPLFAYGYGLTSSTNSISDRDNQSFTVFPNPATDFITVQTEHDGIIAVYDLLGTLVYKTNTYNTTSTISIRNLKSGVYIIKFVNEHGLITSKFVKQ